VNIYTYVFSYPKKTLETTEIGTDIINNITPRLVNDRNYIQFSYNICSEFKLKIWKLVPDTENEK